MMMNSKYKLQNTKFKIVLVLSICLLLWVSTYVYAADPPPPPPIKQLTADLSPVDFGSVTTGSSSEKTLTVTNTSNIDGIQLTVEQISPLPPNPPFVIVKNDCSTKTLNTGEVCTIKVKFTPQTAVKYDTDLNIPYKDADNNQYTLTAALTGEGTAPSVSAGRGGGGGCFIATAAYGSYLHSDVRVLREFRDSWLIANFTLQIAEFKIEIPNIIGRAFVKFYYTVSPPIADFIARHESLRPITRGILTPIVYTVQYPLLTGFLVMICGFVLIIRKKLSI